MTVSAGTPPVKDGRVEKDAEGQEWVLIDHKGPPGYQHTERVAAVCRVSSKCIEQWQRLNRNLDRAFLALSLVVVIGFGALAIAAAPRPWGFDFAIATILIALILGAITFLIGAFAENEVLAHYRRKILKDEGLDVDPRRCVIPPVFAWWLGGRGLTVLLPHEPHEK